MHLVNTEQQNAEIIKTAPVRKEVIKNVFLKYYQPHDKFYTGRKEYLLGEATLNLFRLIFQDEEKAQQAYRNTWFFPKTASYSEYIPLKYQQIKNDLEKESEEFVSINLFDDDESFLAYFNTQLLFSVNTYLVLKKMCFLVDHNNISLK